MPRKPRKSKREKRQLTLEEIAYFFDGDVGDHLFFHTDSELRNLWESHKEEFLPLFIAKHPGQRPGTWWLFDAPRWDDPYKEYYFHGTLPEPRRHLGGIGTPNYEVLASMPSFNKGIPDSWITKSDVDYYNGRAKDIHGKRITTTYNEGDFKGVAPDPNDPPIFESEATYLLRHDLLTEYEKKYLAKNPGLREPEKIKIENNKLMKYSPGAQETRC